MFNNRHSITFPVLDVWPGLWPAESASNTRLVQRLNQMIVGVHKDGTSDIYSEAYPEEQAIRIRFRIEGRLLDYPLRAHTLRAAMISRVKIKEDLGLSGHRRPQNDKIDFSRFAPLKLELRVASLPTVNGGGAIVVRLLASAAPMPMGQLELSAELAAQFEEMVH